VKRAVRAEHHAGLWDRLICSTRSGPLESVAMISNPPQLDSGLFRESLVVVALTAIGAVIRLWSPGHIGLIHFDEGIYALAGLWAFSPHGWLDLDPNLIPYAPPGFSLLVGLLYLIVGVSDVAAVLISIICGTLTIPAVGWVARRTFGRGAGGAAAALITFSGPHIAFSRMALVDVSFLLFWVIAIGQGQRFLERPKLARAVALGIAVGIAQLFKYSGWVSGVIIPLTAGSWLLSHPSEARSRTTIATWGWGIVAALIAAVVYWPWYQFVESHGGYSALLTHQRSYLGGFSTWPGHLSVQLDQMAALSGGPVWLAFGGFAASFGMLLSVGDLRTAGRFPFRILFEAVSLWALWLIPEVSWWVGLLWIPIALIFRTGIGTLPTYLLVVGWVTISLLTPFYHPYARLWLPVQAFGWILMGGVFVAVRTSVEIAGRGLRWTWNLKSDPLPWFALICISSGLSESLTSDGVREAASIPLLGPSDSVRLACRAIQKDLPKDVKNLRVFARRPVVFYLALSGGVAVLPQPDLGHMLGQADQTTWSLLDMAMMPQDNVSDEDLSNALVNWVVVRDVPTTLNMATLLDIEPAAARSREVNESTSLRLLRPKRAGGLP
jgi:dolichyl-phosphate-mannose-protein mannosyltransferase